MPNILKKLRGFFKITKLPKREPHETY